MKDLRDHLEKFHDYFIVTLKQSKYESEHNERFNKCKDTKTSALFNCHRSGNIELKETKRNRAIKSQDSCKIDGHCISQMSVKKLKDGQVDLVFYQTHIGHEIEQRHCNLSNTRVQIASLLMAGMKEKRILEIFKAKNENDRNHFLKPKISKTSRKNSF